MKVRSWSAAALAVFGAALSQGAFAHGLHADAAGVGSGLAHPFVGLDHLLAMLAVGLWAAQAGGRAVWALPAAFLAMMGAGAALAWFGVDLPAVEPGVAASVLVLGLLVAMAVRLPVALAAGVVAAFAVLHGYAHGAEMPVAGSVAGYVVGFLAGTALLHATGLGIGTLLRERHAALLRFAGAGVALLSAGLFVAAR